MGLKDLKTLLKKKKATKGICYKKTYYTYTDVCSELKASEITADLILLSVGMD